MAQLTGRPPPSDSGAGNGEAAARRLEEESNRIRDEREKNERMIRDVEESAAELSRAAEDGLKEGAGADTSSSGEHERRRWEEGLGVEDEVRDFIFDLERSSRIARSSRKEPEVTKPHQKYSLDEPV